MEESREEVIARIKQNRKNAPEAIKQLMSKAAEAIVDGELDEKLLREKIKEFRDEEKGKEYP